MLAYVIRRLLYAVPILVGVNLLLFLLFFFVYTPDDMAETILGGTGGKHVTREQKDQWKRQHGYHLPRLVNTSEKGLSIFTQTIFFQKNMPLFLFRFGKADSDQLSIGRTILDRIPYSLALTLPIFLASLILYVSLAMIVAFYRATYVDTWALLVCVLFMSVSTMFYILGGQYLVAIRLRLAPVSGFGDTLAQAARFLILPVIIGIVENIGGGIRYYRTIFLEEINKDYVRTARAKGLGEGKVLFKHALKNAMLPILTNVVVTIPFLIIGSMLFENFFGIPGLGSFLIEAIHKQDFAAIRAMVFLGSVLYIAALIGVDVSYTLVDPRVRLE